MFKWFRKTGLVLAVCLLGFQAQAQAAATNLSIVINSAPSTSLTCTINYPSGQSAFTAPVAAGTLVATCTVAPSSWSGALTLSGADASSFALSGQTVVVGSSAIATARTYSVTVTATP